MTWKSKIVVLAASLTMAAPVISTGLTNVSADTVNDNSAQISTRNIVISPTQGVVTVSASKGRLFTDNFELVAERYVTYQSAWKTDKIAYDSATGKEYFRIAPNEWLVSDDVVFSY